jgi:hypothetical protein
MSIPKAVLFATAFFSPISVCAAQTSQGTAPANNFSPSKPSDILQRSLDEVQMVTSGVKLDKWKRGSVRDEAANNVDAIQRDLKNTLPGLMRTADSAPGSLSKVLPLSRNIDALYDVMVHVVEASRVSAPGDQVGQLQQAMADLEKARVTLGNQLLQTADVQEKQMLELRTTVQTQAASLRAAAAAPPPAKCPAPATPAKKKKKAPTPTATTPGTTAKPSAGTAAKTP